MRQWTPAERSKQAELIQKWKPWLKAGVKTEIGKIISRMNAYKHGGYSKEAYFIRKLIAECRRFLK